MDLSTAVAGAVAILRRKPADVLPFYLLGLAVPAMTQAITVVGVAISYAYLDVTGRLDRFRVVLAEADPPALGADPDQAAVEAWVEAVLPLVELLFPPTVLGILVLTLLAVVVVSFVAYAGAAAGQMAACYGRVRNERGLTAGIGGVRRYWLAFLGLSVLELALWLGLTLLAVVIVAVAALASPIAGALAGIVTVVAWLVGVVAVRALFAFAPAAIVIDDRGVAGALRASWGFIRTHPGRALLYYAIAVGLIAAFVVGFSAVAVVGGQTLAAPVGAALLAPVLDLIKVGLFAGYRGTASVQPAPDTGLRASVARGLRRGVGEVAGFVREAPGLQVLAIALLAGGFGIGWAIAEPYADIVQTSIAGRLQGHVPPIAAANLFANNWTVAVSTIYAGVAIGVPSVVVLWFNGVVLGGYARLEVDPAELAAFVLPHGILELPAIAVAGATGLWVGRAAWRTWRGRSDRATFASALERAFWIAVGLGVVLLVAAVVEGFVSPYYYRLLW